MGGGAATTTGTTFQEDVAAYFACLVLAERKAVPPLGLPPDTCLVGVSAETSSPVDDLAVDTSAGGRIFLQAKTSPSLSDKPASELQKVVRQFVRQGIEGYSVPTLARRALDPTRDRLVLVVDFSAPDTIADDLRGVLDKLRTASEVEAWQRLDSTLNKRETESREKLRTLLRTAWKEEAGRDLEATQEFGLTGLIHVLQLDRRPGSPDMVRAQEHLRDSVLRDPHRSEEAWNALIAVCRGFSPKHTGGDLAYLRAELERMGVQLQSVPSYASDIEALRDYTRSRLEYLKRLSLLRLSGKVLKIARPVVEDLRTFASEDHVVVAGEPGAGKSGCLHDVAERLVKSGTDTVLMTADLMDAASPEAIARDLGISPSRRLIDVLASWTGDGLAYLILDALDAARSGPSLHVLREQLLEIRERAPRWRIIASIREYDLRASLDVQELFRGQPHPTRRHPQFPSVRHLYVERLSEEELAQLATLDERLGATVAQAPAELHELLRNPFNLRLLCDLVAANVARTEIEVVTARFSLLELYWRHRVEHGTAFARGLLLKRAVNKMVAARSLFLAPDQAAEVGGAQVAEFDGLLSDGVLVEAPPLHYGGTSPICFAHNILYDYAVSRNWLRGLEAASISELEKPENEDLIIALYPSIALAFEGLWYAESRHSAFWDRAIAIAEANGIRLVGKIIAANVAASSYKTTDDTRELLVRLSSGQQSAVEVLRHTITAAVTRFQSNPQSSPFVGVHAQDWLGLAAELTAHLNVMSDGVRFLLVPVAQGMGDATKQQRMAANVAAVALIHHGLGSASDIRMVRSGLEVAALTIEARSAETAVALGLVLEPDRIAQGGHEWLLPLAEHVGAITGTDRDLGLRIVEAAFANKGKREDAVPLGSRIVPLVFNKQDLFAMARHRIAESFRELFALDPVTSTRMVVRIMRLVVAAEHPELDKPNRIHELQCRGRTVRVRPDASYIWASGDHNRFEEWWKILGEFRDGLVLLATAGRRPELDGVLDVVSEDSDLAVVWTQLLLAGRRSPAILGPWLAELLASTVILGEMETRTAAGELISACYEHLSTKERLSIEVAIRRLPGETPGRMSEYALERRNRILGCIPLALIESEDLRTVRKELDASGRTPPNTPDFSTTHEWSIEPREVMLRRQGIEPDRPANAALLACVKEVESIPDHARGVVPSQDQAASALAVLVECERRIEVGRKDGADEALLEDASDKIISGCERLAAVPGFGSESPVTQFIRPRLLQAVSNPRPAPRPRDDADWDEGRAMWSSPSPRVDAALGLMLLASRAETSDPQVLAGIEQCAADPVPAVRFQVLSYAAWLQRTAPEVMWRIVERGCKVELRIGVLASFADRVLLGLPDGEDGRLCQAVWGLYRRVRLWSRAGDIRKSTAMFILRAAVWRQDRAANRYLALISAAPFRFGAETSAVIRACRDMLRHREPAADPENNRRIRAVGFDFLCRLVESLKVEARRLRSAYGSTPFDKWVAGDLDRLRAVHQLAHGVATEVYFASGAHDARAASADATTAVGSAERVEFLAEGQPLFDLLCDIEFVESAYDVLKTLEFLVGADADRVLLLIAKLIRNATRDGIQYESLATDVIVRVVERYLAEHAVLLRVKPSARSALLEILDVFVAAGWPSATRLTYRLGEVFR